MLSHKSLPKNSGKFKGILQGMQSMLCNLTLDNFWIFRWSVLKNQIQIKLKIMKIVAFYNLNFHLKIGFYLRCFNVLILTG